MLTSNVRTSSFRCTMSKRPYHQTFLHCTTGLAIRVIQMLKDRRKKAKFQNRFYFWQTLFKIELQNELFINIVAVFLYKAVFVFRPPSTTSFFSYYGCPPTRIGIFHI